MDKVGFKVQSFSGKAATCVLMCKSAEILCRSKEWAKKIDLDEEVPRTMKYYPHGKEKTITKNFRLGDYFESIELSDESNGLSFELIFHIRQGISSHWKDLMMAVLRSIAKNSDSDI